MVRNPFESKTKEPGTLARRRAVLRNVDRILLCGMTVLGVATLIYAWQNAHLDIFPTLICALALVGWGVISLFVCRKQ